MRRIILYIAMSLDGYIADKNGSVSWIRGNDPEVNSDGGYEDFIKDIDTIIMGKATYRQITEELSPDQWVYPDQLTYVITHNPCQDTSNIHFVTEEPDMLVKRVKKTTGKNIWICGGASIIAPLMEKNLIDEYQICMIPQILGSGISLFKNTPLSLKLMQVQEENGMLLCTYLPQKENDSNEDSLCD